MLQEWFECLLGFVIGVVLHQREKLTDKEEKAKASASSRLVSFLSRERQTKRPVIIALIGIVGSGKSSVARELAELITGVVIETDDIRNALRDCNEGYAKARAIAEDIAFSHISYGNNVILDSDFVDVRKRASLREKARRAGVPVFFIRVRCDFDVALWRITLMNPGEFFEKAFTKWYWFGSEKEKGRVVKLREMWRRTPLHYDWSSKNGGKFSLKKPPCWLLADIDTTKEGDWQSAVGEVSCSICEEY